MARYGQAFDRLVLARWLAPPHGAALAPIEAPVWRSRGVA